MSDDPGLLQDAAAPGMTPGAATAPAGAQFRLGQGSFYPIPYLQTYGGKPAPYASIFDQIGDAMGMPSRYAQSPMWNNGAGRYAYASGNAYGPNSGRNAPWNVGQGGGMLNQGANGINGTVPNGTQGANPGQPRFGINPIVPDAGMQPKAGAPGGGLLGGTGLANNGPNYTLPYRAPQIPQGADPSYANWLTTRAAIGPEVQAQYDALKSDAERGAFLQKHFDFNRNLVSSGKLSNADNSNLFNAYLQGMGGG